jgi:hypothetical protein
MRKVTIGTALATFALASGKRPAKAALLKIRAAAKLA